MIKIERGRLLGQLARHERVKLKPYYDDKGILTIAMGRNLEQRGLTRREALYLANNDVDLSLRELTPIAAFRRLDPVRQAVLVNMHFNMGLPRLRTFRRMWAALERGDVEAAAAEMLDSKWAREDVGDSPPPGDPPGRFPYGQRAWELAEMMRLGRWPEDWPKASRGEAGA